MLAGEGALRGELEAMVAARGLSGRVLLPGHVEDMPAAYAAADIVLHTSTDAEAFGRTLVEAGAMERVVIASDLGAPRETVRPGETGWLVPPGDPAALAEAVLRALAEPPERRAAMGQAARQLVLARFTTAAMQRATLAVYAELLGPSPSERVGRLSGGRALGVGRRIGLCRRGGGAGSEGGQPLGPCGDAAARPLHAHEAGLRQQRVDRAGAAEARFPQAVAGAVAHHLAEMRQMQRRLSFREDLPRRVLHGGGGVLAEGLVLLVRLPAEVAGERIEADHLVRCRAHDSPNLGVGDEAGAAVGGAQPEQQRHEIGVRAHQHEAFDARMRRGEGIQHVHRHADVGAVLQAGDARAVHHLEARSLEGPAELAEPHPVAVRGLEEAGGVQVAAADQAARRVAGDEGQPGVGFGGEAVGDGGAGAFAQAGDDVVEVEMEGGGGVGHAAWSRRRRAAGKIARDAPADRRRRARRRRGAQGRAAAPRP